MTSRSYSDLRVFSPNRKTLLEALSPDNGNELVRNGTLVTGHDFGAFQRNFRYQLREMPSGTVLWERWQQRKEPSPVRAYVSDDGQVVVRAHLADWSSEKLLVLDRSGSLRLVVVVTSADASGSDKAIEPDEAREENQVEPPHVTWSDVNVHASTAGPCWTGGSTAVFINAPDPYFSLRTWWGRRIVVNLGAMELVPDESLTGSIEDAIRLEERQQALGFLRCITPEAVGSPADPWELSPLLGALAVVMDQRLAETLPLLRALENVGWLGHSETSHVLGRDWHTKSLLGRVLARLALRFIGAEPTPGGNYTFGPGAPWAKQEALSQERLEVASGPAASWDVARSLPKGARPEEVLARLGAPDFIQARSRKIGKFYVWSEVWDYDGPAVSTRLTWSFPEDSSRSATDQPRVLEKGEVIEPPAWASRDRLEALFRYAPG